ncbi:MAG: phenylalanine--tRNA ligase subunit beta [Coriobacteriaceae bacterium]|jgi:phenylalanyl-tRNA synthetase beta chain|nr:phenylalanine--tRNA ligase subunit beta [Atopobium sp.]MCH4080735.1 phenylalanine--tRNA ligase subunit beta [Atopobiaceae bacterium]MCI1498476.1 phenylalanine--tRNA ligase subunit beta [Atopobiaceae bacterium]MCI1540203.1 phenylalanine--tRNA ligase subunit beta [Atopobiaceae bacterium]RRF95252.1 MAG: phenylalanine--tRNA ligase subunit beta [Coriobacteriaceae bacterium]
MRVSYEWLKDMVDVPEDPKDLVKEYIHTGTEVEAVEKVGADLEHVVTGKVLTKVPHPDSDHMWLTTVDVGMKNVDKDGKPEPLQIVCGAQNFNAGDHIVVAMIGAHLPGDVKIKKSKLRGVESYGMNCSERELGLGSDHSGIMILPEDAPVGVDFTDYYGISDTVVDCEITPNRPDCLSMEGMAVETSAIFDEDTHITEPQIKSEIAARAEDLVDVTIADPALCQRYVARVVKNVKIGPSPEWLARRVEAAGSRTINNVVDVTNYVMYLTGQPLHAFDLNKLGVRDGKRHIVIRAAEDGEKVTTLDHTDRDLTSDMIVITDDGKTPVALAGVMGGLNSEIDDNTTDVLLESACFDKGHISRTSRNLDLMSEASIRFERQVDAAACSRIADIAAALFEECCGAEVCTGKVDNYPAPVEPAHIHLRTQRVCALSGADIEPDFMAQRLRRLGCAVTPAEDGFDVVAPTNRPDLTREVDLIEEILRLWGEDEVEATLPAARNHAGGLTVDQQRIRKIGATLRALGLSETQTYNFADARDLERLHMSEKGRGIPVQIINPLVADQSQMRRSMLPGLLRSVEYNISHGEKNIALYEIGRVFFGHEHKSQPDEPRFVCGVMSGAWDDDQWNRKYPKLNFFDAKGVVQELLKALRITKVRYKVADQEEYGWLQPGCAAEIYAHGGELIGWVGNIHPEVLQNFEVEQDVVAFELSVEALLRLAKRELPYQEVPTLPGVSVDLAIVVDEDVTAETVEQRIQSAGGKLLADVRLFDVFRDKQRVGEGKKSLAFSLTYRAADHTLTSDEVEKAHDRLVKKVMRAVNGEVRS